MRDLMLNELRFSIGLVLSGEEVVPRFRVVAPGGVTVVFLPLPDDLRERVRRMTLMRGYLVWRMATSFVLSAESKQPDAVTTIGVTQTDCYGVMRRILRKPLTVGPEEWLSEKQIGEGFPNLLRQREAALDLATIEMLERVFGPSGEFEVKTVN